MRPSLPGPLPAPFLNSAERPRAESHEVYAPLTEAAALAVSAGWRMRNPGPDETRSGGEIRFPCHWKG
jgi:hypothetical protein